MSSGKRLAKRSILGTRVSALFQDERYYGGVIQATKTKWNGRETYSVKFENGRVMELQDKDIIGPGFRSVSSVILREGQRVFVTVAGREVSGIVLQHLQHGDEVTVKVQQGEHGKPQEITRRIQEVRLLESRKSARLVYQDTDYSRMADPVLAEKKRPSSSIDVPFYPRKRCIASIQEDVQVMDERMAAMVLTSLSCSPISPQYKNTDNGSWSSDAAYSSSYTSTPSPPSFFNNNSNNVPVASPPSTVDEGIDMDEGSIDFMEEASPRKRKMLTRTMYECSWHGCRMVLPTSGEIEQHVRETHLGKKLSDSEDMSDGDNDDHEEEFYYNEIEVVTNSSPHSQISSPLPGNVPMEISAPIQDDPIFKEHQYGEQNLRYGNQSDPTSVFSTFSSLRKIRTESAPVSNGPGCSSISSSSSSSSPTVRKIVEQCMIRKEGAKPPPASPISIPGMQKSFSWRLNNSPTFNLSQNNKPFFQQQYNFSMSPKSPAHHSVSPKASPMHKKARGDVRKCRKVYGMENRDMWCTQCKWKKACSRFMD